MNKKAIRRIASCLGGPLEMFILDGISKQPQFNSDVLSEAWPELAAKWNALNPDQAVKGAEGEPEPAIQEA